MTAKVIPLVDQRAASRVPVIPAHAPARGGTLADTRGRLLRDLRISTRAYARQGRAPADTVSRQARGRHPHDLGRRARGAGHRLLAQPGHSCFSRLGCSRTGATLVRRPHCQRLIHAPL